MQEVSLWKKFHITYNFFFIRKIVTHLVTFFLYCVVIPTSVLVPEATIPTWGVVYIPTTITILNAIRNPRLVSFWFNRSPFFQVNNLLHHSCFDSYNLVISSNVKDDSFSWTYYLSSNPSICLPCTCIWRSNCLVLLVAAPSILFHFGSCLRMSWPCIGWKQL